MPACFNSFPFSPLSCLTKKRQTRGLFHTPVIFLLSISCGGFLFFPDARARSTLHLLSPARILEQNARPNKHFFAPVAPAGRTPTHTPQSPPEAAPPPPPPAPLFSP